MTINIANLLNPDVYDHPVDKLELIETHISWVILTGDFAYKIKKPVNFGFLDFSTLDKRYQFCQQEVSLNKRLADKIYLDVVAISGTVDKPLIESDHTENVNKTALEYAVKMTQFPQSAQLDNMLMDGSLNAEHMDAIAHMIAEFHSDIPRVASLEISAEYGSQSSISKYIFDNFKHIREQLNEDQYYSDLDSLEQWFSEQFFKLTTLFKQRKTEGFIRECHGDMHLRNMLWLNGKPMAFDCIEFNPELSWIDVISEVAFLVMDLQDRKQTALANRFLNSYLEETGDYSGLVLMPLYLCYRAMVRAKVSALRLEQENKSKLKPNRNNDLLDEELQQTLAEFESYLQLAISYTIPTNPALIIMRGMSASGKSTVSQQLLDQLGAIRIRSDVERKRLFQMPPQSSSNDLNEINQGMYSTESSKLTYEKLIKLSTDVIHAGYHLIIDAAFLKFKQRELFSDLATELNVPFIILDVFASHDELKRRIVARKNDVSDADLSVLEYQLANTKPLHHSEMSNVISINTESALDINLIVEKIKNL